jgi:hypothetical protein
MLSSGLVGVCKTSMIVCGAQEDHDGPETIAAMAFGQSCRGLYNTVKANVNMLQNLLNSIDEKISICEMKIRENERWEEVNDERLDENGNVIEVRKMTVVSGADCYRHELAGLLRQKAELTGELMDESFYSKNLHGIKGFGDFLQYTSDIDSYSVQN